MNKIIIIGCTGAGKSTFARKLQDKTQLPLYYLDMLWHKPDHTHITREEFDSRLKEIMATDRWIIDGNYMRTIPMRLKECDTVFLLDYPLETCLAGASERVGTKREDMPWTEPTLDEEFKQFILDFSQEQLPVIYELLAEHAGNKRIIVLKSREEAIQYLSTLYNTMSTDRL